jgi:uncharacterized protein (DUF305 family)
VTVPSRPQLVAFAVALLFLAGSVGYYAGTRSTDAAGGDAEVGFLLDMIAHHEQAIEISRTALAGSMPEGVQSFAVEVVADQQYEVGKMETLLESWGHARQREDGAATMDWMGDPVPLDRMPGLASEDDLDRLADARGEEAGALWLALMSNHHRGGVHMAEAAVGRVDDRRVRALAERMARIQAVEINEYESARRRLGLEIPSGLESVPVPAGGGDGHGH